MSIQLEVKIAVMETELKHIKEDIVEIKDDCSSIKDSLDEIKLALAKRDNEGVFDFIKNNYKIILIVLAFFGIGQFSFSELIQLGHASDKQVQTAEKSE